MNLFGSLRGTAVALHDVTLIKNGGSLAGEKIEIARLVPVRVRYDPGLYRIKIMRIKLFALSCVVNNNNNNRATFS